MQPNKRKLYLDILRILACLFVIFNHTGTFGFQLFTTYQTGSFIYFLLSLFTVLCKTAVPVFLMISGALLLGRDLSFKDLWLKRIPKFLLVLIAISFLCYLDSIKDDLTLFSFAEYIKQLYSTRASGHLWYLYAYIAFLMSYPLLNAIAKHLSDKGYYLLILLYVAISIVGILDTYVFEVAMYPELQPRWLTTDIVIFPLIGYFIENRLDIQKFHFNHKLIIGFLGLISLFSAMILSYDIHITTGSAQQTYYSFMVLIPSSAIYIFAKALLYTRKTNSRVANFISTVGACTFGVYLIHMVLPFRGLLVVLFYEVLPIPSPISCVFYCMAVFTLCTIITYLFKKLPIIGKLV